MDVKFFEKYIKEISDYIVLIDELIDNRMINGDDQLFLNQAIKTVKLINGISQIIQNDKLTKLSVEMIDFLEDILINGSEVTEVHFDLIRLTLEYYKLLIKNISDNTLSFSFDALFEALKQHSSAESINPALIYQKDILEKNIQLSSDGFTGVFNNKKKVEVSLSRIDNIINKLNDIVMSQHQLKSEIIKIRESEILLTREIFSQDKKTELDKDLKNALINHISLIKETGNILHAKTIQSERDTFTLQEEILGLRMLPINLITDEIKSKIDQLVGSLTDKKVNIIFPDVNPSLDKFILQKIKRPIENIIINAIQHGIESIDERIKLNKDEGGKISVSFTDSSGKISILIRDDGRGIKYDVLRNKCLEMMPYDSDNIKELSNDELVKFVFYQGITTGENNVNKGFGLYVANNDIEQVKGKIIINSVEGKGVEVEITVPKSLTTVNGFFVKSCNEKFLIPSTFIKEIVYVDRNDLMDLMTKFAISLRNDIIPVYPLSGIIKPSDSVINEKLNIIIVEEFGEKIGIILDEILYHSSVIYKPLPQNIERLKILQGVVFDEDHRIVTILYIPEIIKRLKKIRNIEFRERFSKDNLRYKNILVVDDSVINREIEVNIVKKIHKLISVDVADNGIDALDMLRKKHYDLIITDSAMPKMDGITFIENLRKEENYLNTPVIAIVSSDEKSLIESLKRFGVDDIQYKSRFSREQLVSSIISNLSGTHD